MIMISNAFEDDRKFGLNGSYLENMEKKSKKRSRWSQEDMNSAIRRIKHGELTIRSAARTYQIPRSTISDKISMRSPLVGRHGPSPILTQSEEEAITNWTIQMDKLGFSQTKTDLQNIVKQMLDKSGRSTPFKDNRPGIRWFTCFRRRNPRLVLKQPKPFQKHETRITPTIIDRWFTDFLQYLEETNALTILCEPTRLYICEERIFHLGGKAGKRAFKGKASAGVSKANSSDNSQITVLATVAANGNFPPPLIVLPANEDNVSMTCQKDVHMEAVYVETQHGVMGPSAFLVFLTEIFQPFLIERRVPCPALLFVNELSKYQSPEVLEFCSENSILLYQAPPHSASPSRVSDVSVTGCLDEEWDFAEEVYRENYPGCHVTRTIFLSVFCEAWKRVIQKPSVGVEGFKAMGIYPFTRMYNLTNTMASTASTSKESWPPNHDFATFVGNSAHTMCEDGAEAEGSALSTSAEVPHSILPPASNSIAALQILTPETAPGEVAGTSGLAPLQVSYKDTVWLTRMLERLKQNGSVTIQMDKHVPDTRRSQKGGTHCSTCRCSVEERCQVPKELWKEFLQFQKDKEKKCPRRKKGQRGKQQRQKKPEVDLSQARKGRKRKASDVSYKGKGKKGKDTEMSEENKAEEKEQNKQEEPTVEREQEIEMAVSSMHVGVEIEI